MSQLKTPGVYITEKDAFGNGVVEVATAVPAFIGYTERAEYNGDSFLNKPIRITSLGEYMQYFGGASNDEFTLSETAEGETPDVTVKDMNCSLALSGPGFNLFNSIRLFFANGGGPCYIISVGSYADGVIEVNNLKDGINPLLKEDEPTMIVIPEAIRLSAENCTSLQQAVLSHCQKMMNRIGIFDIHDGYKQRNHPEGDVIDSFRNNLGTVGLMYGTAYYPWLNTSVVSNSELGLTNLTDESLLVLKKLLMLELDVTETVQENESLKEGELRNLLAHIPNIRKDSYNGPAVGELSKTLIVVSPFFKALLKTIQEKLNLLPPAAAMAGIYTLVDNTRGVWKAPANVALSSVVSPAVNISHDEQEDLNVTLHGKSINAIRPFIGEGVLVWGARTLDGNSNDWRYINVRRTMIMLEQSIKIACKAYVFEPNNANTWATIKSMIDSFLFNQWKKGALVGATSSDAYSVSVGLGATMTADDILEGIMRITVLVAVSRPAEFIEITFQQQMQKS